MTLFLLYLWLKLDFFINGLTAISIICFVGSFFSIAFLMGAAGDFDPSVSCYQVGKRIIKWALPIGVSCFLISGLLPSQKQGAYLIAGYAGLKLVETPEMGKLSELVRLKVGNYLDEGLEAAKNEATKGTQAAASAVQTVTGK